MSHGKVTVKEVVHPRGITTVQNVSMGNDVEVEFPTAEDLELVREEAMKDTTESRSESVRLGWLVDELIAGNHTLNNAGIGRGKRSCRNVTGKWKQAESHTSVRSIDGVKENDERKRSLHSREVPRFKVPAVVEEEIARRKE